MGVKGRRLNDGKAGPIIPAPYPAKKENTKHRELCILAAKWLRRSKLRGPSCPYAAVELVTAAQESPDVFGWNYWATVLIEVKVSRSDFLADAKKWFRQHPEEGVGAFRYYCSPEGLIKETDLPENWGLLWDTGGEIKLIKEAERQPPSAQAEIALLSSIMRREGVKAKLFDYRNTRKI